MRRATQFIAVLALLIGICFGSADAVNPFNDIAGNNHANNIDAIYNAGITLGCGANTYCPSDFVRRDQMAAFLARTAALSSGTTKNFPVANARGQIQAYCALVAANPGSFDSGPCQPSVASFDVTGTGTQSSVAIGGDGLPIVAYYAEESGSLKVAHCVTTNCSEVNTVLVDAGDNLGGFPAIAIGSDGLALISYYDFVLGDLKVAHCDDLACNSPTITTLDSTGIVGADTAIAIGGDGLGLISYYDQSNTNLKVAHCSNVACTTASVNTLHASVSDDVGAMSSMAIAPNGFGIISYYDTTNSGLRVARCTNALCSTATFTLIDNSAIVGQYSSITIGSDGLGIISFADATNGTLRVAHCTVDACTSSTVAVVHATEGQILGRFSSIAIATNGRPIISYLDSTADTLRFARCATNACTGATSFATLATAAQGSTSIAVGTDGVPVVSFLDLGTNAIAVARPAAA